MILAINICRNILSHSIDLKISMIIEYVDINLKIHYFISLWTLSNNNRKPILIYYGAKYLSKIKTSLKIRKMTIV